MNKQQVINDILKLEKDNSVKQSKYRRNLRLYTYSPNLGMNNLSDETVVGFYQRGYFNANSDMTSSVQENIIASCIDTLVSKIACKNVRSYLNLVNGSTYRDIQVMKASQQFFDQYYTEIVDANKLVSEAFRDACVFDTGYLFVDYVNGTVKRVLPWQVFLDARESSYGKNVRLVYKQEQLPVSLAPFKCKVNTDYVDVYYYWNCKEHTQAMYVPTENIYQQSSYEHDVLPVLSIHFQTPLKGSTSQSITDYLYGIQMLVDQIVTKVKESATLTSPCTYFVPEASSIKVNKLTNRAGDIITYTPTANMTGSPVTVDHPNPVDPAWLALLAQLKQDAYELVGISQLSATSQKPRGLNSGVALQTMEDIEADRFETQLKQVVRMYSDLTRRIVELFPDDENILPVTLYNPNVTWSDIKALNSTMQIQYSAMDALSKDPQTKYQQLQLLQQAGVLTSSRIAQLMEIPDIQQGYSLMNNAINAVMTCIDDCIYNGNFETPDYVPHDMLQDELLNTMLSLKAAGNPENEEIIQRLKQYYAVIEQRDKSSMTSAEMAATMSLQQELMQAMPDIEQQVAQATQTMLADPVITDQLMKGLTT